MIEVKDLKKNYGLVKALRGVSFAVDRGQVVGLLGPNGAGKTTAMRIVTGYLAPSAGSAKIDGVEVVEDPDHCQRQIGYLPEGNPLYMDLRLMEALRFSAEMHGLRGAERDAGIKEAVHAAGLEGKERRIISGFSRGYKQRVGLAQALLHKPAILILDEPTSGLDPNQQEDMRELVRNRALIINNGQLVADGTVAEIRRQAAADAGVRMTVRGAKADVESAFSALPFVGGIRAEAAPAGPELLNVQLEIQEDVTPQLLEAVSAKAFEAKLPLSALSAEEASLEAVFAELTEERPDAVSAAPPSNGEPAAAEGGAS